MLISPKRVFDTFIIKCIILFSTLNSDYINRHLCSKSLRSVDIYVIIHMFPLFRCFLANQTLFIFENTLIL